MKFSLICRYHAQSAAKPAALHQIFPGISLKTGVFRIFFRILHQAVKDPFFPFPELKIHRLDLKHLLKAENIDFSSKSSFNPGKSSQEWHTYGISPPQNFRPISRDSLQASESSGCPSGICILITGSPTAVFLPLYSNSHKDSVFSNCSLPRRKSVIST